MANADVNRIVNSQEIQSAIRSKISQKRKFVRKKNPLRNFGFMVKLNPQALALRRRILLAKEKADKQKAAAVDAKRKGTPVDKKVTEQLKVKKVKAKKLRASTKKFRTALLS